MAPTPDHSQNALQLGRRFIHDSWPVGATWAGHVEPPAAARARQPLTAGPRGVPFLSRGAGRLRIITRRCRLGQFLPAGILGNGKETPVAHGCPARIAPWFLFIAPNDQSIWLVGFSRPWLGP